MSQPIRKLNRLDLSDRVAIVTGGARGIGSAVARRILLSGGKVALWDVDQDALERTRTELSAFGDVGCATVELTSESEIKSSVQKTLQRFGKIDIVINNAGITGGNKPTWELDPEVWRRVIEVNLIAPFLLCHAVVPALIANGYGRIVNVASVAGKEGNPNASHYSASKAGLIGLTKSLAKELATQNILVNCVTPAAAKTDIFLQMKQEHIDYMLSKIPMNRFVEPDEVAALICWLASDECSFSTGAVFDVSGGRATY
jgi:NAD(P)-dependent dehydrogenase (short-subunit alcohol dehydrogenase family)